MSWRASDWSPEAFEALLARGLEEWNAFVARRGGLYHKLIPADHRGAREPLEAEAGWADRFLELGSGLGVVTILAERLGYRAVGIEIDPELVDLSSALAEEFGSRATFVEGSFVPVPYRDEVELLEGDSLTLTEGADAYEELGLELGDFDVVFGFPWPGEEDWLNELVRRHAGPTTGYLSFENREGWVWTPQVAGTS